MYKVYYILNFFSKFTELDSKEIGSDVSIGDILLWAIIFNRTELAEICWLREKDHICKEKKQHEFLLFTSFLMRKKMVSICHLRMKKNVNK